MRNFLIFLVAAASCVFSQSSDKGIISTIQAEVGWGPTTAQGKTLLMLGSGGYKRESTAGTFVALDTASVRPFATAPGACSRAISIENPTNISQPIQYCRFDYSMRVSDVAQSGVRFKFYTRYMSDSVWQVGQSQWDTVKVITWHTPPSDVRTTTRLGWGHRWSVSGQLATICAEKTATGPSTGDTVYVIKPVLRCW